MSVRAASKLKDIYADLRQKITGGTFKEGDLLPTTGELAKAFECSVGMVSKAIAMLIHEGSVEQRRGLGTRVIKNRSVQLDAVAFIYPSEQHEGIRRVAQGFQEAAHAVRRRVVLLSTGTDYHQEGEIIGRLDEFDVKGAVVYPVLPEPQDRVHFEQMLLRCRFPVVLATALPGFGRPAVDQDGFHAGWTMTRHLLGRGLKRIGFLATYAWMPAVRESYLGYRQAMEAAGIAIEPEWVVLDPAIQPDFEHPLAKGEGVVSQFLQSAVEGDLEGVVCSDDFLALVCLASARKRGISVPDQFKVAGIADYAISAQSDPPLTTYHGPFEEIGRQSFQTLNHLLQGGKPVEREIQLRGSLVVRQSA
jgi:DNA-binding LacI/PurR family transcriptional regulator